MVKLVCLLLIVEVMVSEQGRVTVARMIGKVDMVADRRKVFCIFKCLLNLFSNGCWDLF